MMRGTGSGKCNLKLNEIELVLLKLDVMPYPAKNCRSFPSLPHLHHVLSSVSNWLGHTWKWPRRVLDGRHPSNHPILPWRCIFPRCIQTGGDRNSGTALASPRWCPPH